MTYSWPKWLKHWRAIADASSPTKYEPIVATVDKTVYEVLRVSRYHADDDGDKPHVETSIRGFNDRTALFSKATRDLGIVRVITNNRKPMFVIEPGADALEWRCATEGVTAGRLVKVMRAGDLGRRIRRRDRKAAKDSQERQVAIEQELRSELTDARERVAELERHVARMQETIIKRNEEPPGSGRAPLSSGSLADGLGKAQERGVKLTSDKPLPGSFGG